jgi:hypothetical protein
MVADVSAARLPARSVELGFDEPCLATLHGLGDSGLTLTARRLVACRGELSASLALDAIDRVLVDTGRASSHADLVFLPATERDVPLVLVHPVREVIRALGFVLRVADAAGRSATAETLGPVLRVTLAPAAGPSDPGAAPSPVDQAADSPSGGVAVE